MSIRPAIESDLPAILAIYGPYVENTAYSFEYTVPTTAEFTDRFRRITAQFPWLVWEENGQVAGYAYGSAPFSRAAYRWDAEISIYVAPEYHGKGIGKKLVHALEELLRRQGYATIYSIITEENRGSVAFHAKIGYQFLVEIPRCGFKFGRWLGIIWMEKRLCPDENPTAPPTPWPALVKNTRNLSEILDKITLS